MLTRVRAWWRMRKIRKEALEWLTRLDTDNPRKLRTIDEGGWFPVEGNNADQINGLTTKSLEKLAKELELKKERQPKTFEAPVEFIEHVMLKREGNRKC